MKLFDDMKDSINVEAILTKAKIDKNNFFLLNLSANNPKKGAETINNIRWKFAATHTKSAIFQRLNSEP